MAPSDLMNRSAAEFRADIENGRRTKRRIKALCDEYNDCQLAARKQEIHLSRPSHVLTHPTALGWRWESGDWTFIGLSEDELADTPYYVIHLPVFFGEEPDMARAHQSSHRTFIDALDSVQWRLGRGILATPADSDILDPTTKHKEYHLMKQDTKEYIDNEVNNLATVLRKEVSDIAQGIHERIAAVQRDLDAVKSHTDDHCRLGAHNANVTNAVIGDLQRRLTVLDKLAGISSESPQLDAELDDLNERFDAASARANNPFASLFEGIFGGPSSGGISILGGPFGS